MNNVLLSIIIPVYNAEKYIKSCLDSILACNFQNLLEIILIDDGSTDHSLELLRDYQQNNNIKIFTQTNRGAGETRNRGIKESNGLYIWFVDIDDLVNCKKFDLLIPILQKENIDILLFNFLLLYPTGKLDRYGMFDLPTTNIVTGINFFIKNRIYPVPWNKIFKRSFLVQHDLYFIPGFLPEDMELMTRCFLYAQKVKCVALDLYYWRITPNSLSKRSTLKYLDGYIRTLESHLDLACRYPHVSFWLKDFLYVIYEINNKIADSGKLEYLEMEQVVVKKIIKKLPLQLCFFDSWKEYLIILSICINPNLFFKLKHLKR